jgi:hypothetical protein
MRSTNRYHTAICRSASVTATSGNVQIPTPCAITPAEDVVAVGRAQARQHPG